MKLSFKNEVVLKAFLESFFFYVLFIYLFHIFFYWSDLVDAGFFLLLFLKPRSKVQEILLNLVLNRFDYFTDIIFLEIRGIMRLL